MAASVLGGENEDDYGNGWFCICRRGSVSVRGGDAVGVLLVGRGCRGCRAVVVQFKPTMGGLDPG